MPRSLLKPHASVFRTLGRLLDPLFAVCTGALLYLARPPVGALVDHYLMLLAVSALAIVLVFPVFQLYQPQRGESVARELGDLVLAWSVVAAIIVAGLFVTKTGESISRVWMASWFVAGLAALAATRIATRLVLRHWRRNGRNLRHIAIVGAGALGARIAETLARESWTGFNVIGYYDDDPSLHGRSVAQKPVLGSPDRLASDVESLGIDQVWLAIPLRAELRMRAILDMTRQSAVEVRLVPDIFGFHLLNHSFSEVAGLPVVSLTASPMAGFARIGKAVEDAVLGSLLFVLALPLMLLIAACIKATSRGPVLYRQQRVTENARSFTMLKFRTMPVAAEAASGAVWSRHGEDRATPFGRLLRRYSLDELPQLLNVLGGDMSLVGPRPERPEFVARFRAEIPGYMQKHLVKAGITGWAQVNDLRGDSDLARRIQYDLYYIDRWSLWFDLRILALTLWHILKSRNAH